MSVDQEYIDLVLDRLDGKGFVFEVGDATSDNPIRFSSFDNDEVITHLALYSRFNSSVVLRIDVHAARAKVSGMLREKLRTMTDMMPFCSVRFDSIDDSDASTIVLTHSLLVDDELSWGQISQVIGSLAYITERVDGLVANDTPGGTSDTEEESTDTNDREVSASMRASNGSTRPASATVSPDDVLAELDKLVGMAPVKTMVRQLTARQKMERIRRARGLKQVLPSPHLVFTGNPGTGKTTVARHIGQLYRSLGLLRSGHVIEANRSTLVAAYVGQTALKTRAVCESALHGVLFIDEAYSLMGSGHDFGPEALEELMTFMENNRGKFVVVLAGYPEEMSELLTSNPGLKSRFDIMIDFPDYSDEELMRIFLGIVEDNDYRLEGAAGRALAYLVEHMDRGRGFGNGREMRKLFSQVADIHALRLMKVRAPSARHLTALTALDFIPLVNERRAIIKAERRDAPADLVASGAVPYGYL